ncbi:MAG: four helix bundle protein [Candidatus Peregrinibacteria bacterium]
MEERPYQKLVVWKEAHALCLEVYAATKSFPPEEKYGLTIQMRRASYSIPMNIAEGNGRCSKNDRAHFLEIAYASVEELHYQCPLAHDLHYLSSEKLSQLHDKIQRTGYLLFKLRDSLR